MSKIDMSKIENQLSDVERKFASLKFWTPELIEWIGRENDPVKLAVASCLVNSHQYPDWLPGKPINYGKISEGDELYYIVAVYDILKRKSERIAPELHSYIWLTEYYNKYVDEEPNN